MQAVLACPPIQRCTHPESGAERELFDCPDVALSLAGPRVRLIVVTHLASSAPPPVGVQHAGTVSELFISTLSAPAFTAKDVLDLYLHRSSFETVLADEDREQDADRWCRSAWLAMLVRPMLPN